jgi:hypothetical protein
MPTTSNAAAALVFGETGKMLAQLGTAAGVASHAVA